MRVECSIHFYDGENEEGHEVEMVEAECERCGNTEQSYGQGENSILRCLALMRENCPRGENNFYVSDQ